MEDLAPRFERYPLCVSEDPFVASLSGTLRHIGGRAVEACRRTRRTNPLQREGGTGRGDLATVRRHRSRPFFRPPSLDRG